MAIEGVGWPTAPRIGSRVTNRAGTGFAIAADQTSDAPPATAGTMEAASLGAVLTFQEMGTETVEDREARKHGQDMLALLAALQRGLLNGVDNPVALQQLAELAAAVPRATDRRLAAMISAIVVRVRVELARRQI